MDILKMMLQDLRKVMEAGEAGADDDETVIKDWTQVGKLSPEDMGRRKAQHARSSELKRELEVLKKKIKAVHAQNDVDAEEWWNHLYKTYGLSEGDHHIVDDGRIYKKPAAAKP
jgi:hypothetical protein